MIKEGLSRLCIHTITTRPWDIESAAARYAAAGVGGITVWREALEGRSIKKTAKVLRDHGLSIVSLCRGGFFPAREKSKREAAIEENRRIIADAADLGAPLIVLVCGADHLQSLEDSRSQIKDALAVLGPEAQSAGIKLAIEPLHPMYADTRSAINMLAQANDMATELNLANVGVAIDVYHVWWDPTLEVEIKRCGDNGHLFAFHVCDWKVPTQDLLWDRGLMGTGCIPIRRIRSWIEQTGYKGFIEVEIFSNSYWKQDQGIFLADIIEAYKTSC